MKEILKKQVRERARFCCEYCFAQMLYSADVFSIEHILPIIKGGLNILSNLALACQCCNNHKFTATQAIDIVTGSRVNLYNPRIDKWADHFEWHEGFTEIIGTSATGRATVRRLDLNREGLVNLRRVLFAAGFHPPF